MLRVTEQGQGPGMRPPPADHTAMERSLDAVYAHARLEEVIRAVAEDALNPSPITLMWQHESSFEAALSDAFEELARTATGMLAERLAEIMDTAPPRLAGRLGSPPRWFEDT